MTHYDIIIINKHELEEDEINEIMNKFLHVDDGYEGPVEWDPISLGEKRDDYKAEVKDGLEDTFEDWLMSCGYELIDGVWCEAWNPDGKFDYFNYPGQFNFIDSVGRVKHACQVKDLDHNRMLYQRMFERAKWWNPALPQYHPDTNQPMTFKEFVEYDYGFHFSGLVQDGEMIGFDLSVEECDALSAKWDPNHYVHIIDCHD